MMDGGRVPYANGSAGGGGGVGATARAQGKTDYPGFVAQVLGRLGDMFFSPSDITPEVQFPDRLEGEGLNMRPTQKPKSLVKETPPKNYGRNFEQNPLASEGEGLMPSYIPRPNVPQARAQGGFVGEYNYAQPQQATMGTPFPNAVDSNPQQSQSFLRPNDAKKNSRVELADGTTPPPVPKDNPRRRPTDKFQFSHWLEDFNADRNITDKEIAAARERFDRFNVDKIPDNVFSDVDTAVQKAGIVFGGDSGFSKEKIESMVRHTGFVETEYGKTIADTNEPDVKKARSHYQIEPKTAYSLVNPARSGALLGEKFNQEFNYLVPEGSNETAKEYLNNLYTTDNKKFLDTLQNDKYLGATLAAGRYIQVHQQRMSKDTNSFINP